MNMIPYGRQSITDEDIAAVVEVLQSDFLTQGPAVPAFEAAVCARVGASFSVAVNSATSGLHIACLALGVGPGDVVWTSPNSFVASANCALYCGAQVDFVDIDVKTLCMSEQALEDKLVDHARRGLPMPRVVIPVHFGGQSCHMAEIGRLAREYGFSVIEDASHAIGANFMDRPVGDCQFSAATVFSFHPVKIITTGEGGLVTTNCPDLFERMSRSRTHGITRNPESMHAAAPAPWYYEQLDLGLNYRMTDIQAALGCSQLRRLDAFVARRQALATRYEKAFKGVIQTQEVPEYTSSARHLFPIRVPAERRRQTFDRLRDCGIGVNVHYIPIYLHPFYRKLGFKPGLCQAAEAFYSEAISLPMYADLSDGQQSKVIEIIKEIHR
jgi:UDP-4-amino-4,6-dideoxy-N-acetyl-beta-L-altrosamine transaminase